MDIIPHDIQPNPIGLDKGYAPAHRGIGNPEPFELIWQIIPVGGSWMRIQRATDLEKEYRAGVRTIYVQLSPVYSSAGSASPEVQDPQ